MIKKIIKQDDFGNGITYDDKIIFVDKALTDEELEIELTKDKPKYQEARITKIITPSIMRVPPQCKYYDTCGGCQLLHMDYQSQLKFKEEKVNNNTKKYCESISNILTNNNPLHYRNKITLHVINNKLGLYQEKTNTIVEITSCLLVNPLINNIINKIKEKLNISEVKEIVIKVTSTNETMLIIKGSVNKKELINFSDITTIILNNQIITGNGYITEIINDYQFRISPNTFFQVNTRMISILYHEIIDYIKDKKINNCLDLYCGSGTISILISPYIMKVTGIEVVMDAIEDAKNNAQINHVHNVDFICGKVEDNIDKFKTIDLIIVDPPRNGLDNKTVMNILKINPNNLIYVSCNPNTLKRDLEKLKDNYKVFKMTPVDMFPNTNHVETVCVMKLR